MSETSFDVGALLLALNPEARIGALIDRVVARCQATLPAYAALSAASIRTGIEADLARAFAALVEQRPLTDQDRAEMGQIGDLRASQGVPLEQMLQVYRLTTDEIFNEIWRASDDGVLTNDQTVELTRQLWSHADPPTSLAIEAYRARELKQAIAETHGRTAHVYALLLSPATDSRLDGALEGYVDQNASYAALRARAIDGNQHGLLLDLQQPGVLDGGAVALHEGDVIGYTLRRPAMHVHDGIIVGVGPAGPVEALPYSLSVATRAVQTAEDFGISGIRSIDQVALPALARSEPVLGEHMVAKYVRPCEPETVAGAELLQTIRMVLRKDLAVDQAAEALWVHPNTVRNRIRRFEELTGGSLRKVDDLVWIRLALLRAELH